MILFDANILIHAHALTSPYHAIAKTLRDQAVRGELAACLAPQVLCEFFSVSTNERIIGSPMTPQEATREVARYWLESRFEKILPKETTLSRLTELLARHPVKGHCIFDVFLVATMLDNGVRAIYTQNTKDFQQYPEIQAMNPLSHPSLPKQ